MLVATAVFMLMVSLLLTTASHINTAWQQANGQKARRENARHVFSLMNRDLQGAIPAVPGAGTNRVAFQLSSEFHGTPSDGVFWLASLPATRSSSDLATIGYFVTDNHKLYRLQTNAVVPNLADGADTGGTSDATALLAENVVRMDIELINGDGTTEMSSVSYQTNLPRFADVTLLVADARTLDRQPNLLVPDIGNPPEGVQVFRTRVELPTAR